MISGDSTASHMGSVKNIEKARERRTFETMPGSSEVGVPDELLTHANTIHPRMGYDMSDSIFMQEQQAADFSKKAKRASEDRAALEAFRAAALQKPADFSSTPTEKSREKSGNVGAVANSSDHKRKPDRPPPPIAVIKLKKKSSSSSSVGRGSSDGLSSKSSVKRESSDGSVARAGIEERGTSKKKRAGSKKGKSKRHKKEPEQAEDKEKSSGVDQDTGSVKASSKMVAKSNSGGAAAAAGLGLLGLVAYSSGDDDDSETEGT